MSREIFPSLLRKFWRQREKKNLVSILKMPKRGEKLITHFRWNCFQAIYIFQQYKKPDYLFILSHIKFIPVQHSHNVHKDCFLACLCMYEAFSYILCSYKQEGMIPVARYGKYSSCKSAATHADTEGETLYFPLWLSSVRVPKCKLWEKSSSSE